MRTSHLKEMSHFDGKESEIANPRCKKTYVQGTVVSQNRIKKKVKQKYFRNKEH